MWPVNEAAVSGELCDQGVGPCREQRGGDSDNEKDNAHEALSADAALRMKSRFSRSHPRAAGPSASHVIVSRGSSVKPLKEGARNRPTLVHSLYCTSAMS